MYVLGYSENFTGEEALQFIRDAAELVGRSGHIDEALEFGTVGGRLYSIDSPGLFFDNVRGEFYLIVNGQSSGGLYAKCQHCGIWHINNPREGTVRAVDGKHFCSVECAFDEDYGRCDSCHEWFYQYDDCCTCVGDYTYCCDDCAYDAGWDICVDCDEWVNADDMTHIVDHGRVCDYCFRNRDYQYCENCDSYVPNSDACYDEENDATVCCRCHERSGAGFIHEYGWTPPIEFFGSTDGNRQSYIGVELEIDSGNNRSQCAKDLCNIDLANRIWLTRDGSLNNGIEVTSHPMTLEEHLKCGIWEDVVRVARSHGFTSHNNGRCGLHLHINRNFFGKSERVQQVGGYKMMRLMQRFEKQFITFSRRTSTRWCSFSTCDNYSPKPVKVSAFNHDAYSEYNFSSGVIRKANKMVRDERSHSQAVNFEHRNTFEIRIFRGTLRLSTLYASFALANGLARACKFHGETWVENVSWYDLMAWIIADCSTEEIRNYLTSYLVEKELYFTPDFTASTTVSEEE